MLNTNLHPYPVLIITNVTTSTHGSWWLPDRKRTPWEENWAQLFIWICSSENRQEIHWLHSQLLMPYLEQEQKPTFMTFVTSRHETKAVLSIRFEELLNFTWSYKYFEKNYSTSTGSNHRAMSSPAGAHDPDEIVICKERKADTQHPYQGQRKNPTSPASHIDAVSFLDPADNICSWGILSCYHTECRHAMLCQPSLAFLISYKHHMVPHI